MLYADLLLKQIVSGREVSQSFPYNDRDFDMPRKIRDLHFQIDANKVKGETSRQWIEVGEIQVSNHEGFIVFLEQNTSIKSRLMERDNSGGLKDKEVNHPGNKAISKILTDNYKLLFEEFPVLRRLHEI